MSNALRHQSSPYLLQHAHNPVHWFAWDADILEQAKATEKLLIVSIGYATCHWCHVMERESFEDQEVADLMNEHFISIKVDREERPDLDEWYMTACQLVSKRGCGWPLNAIALPDGRPIWAGTYYPKENWMNILAQFVQLKEEQPDRLEEAAKEIERGLLHHRSLVTTKDDTKVELDISSLYMRYYLQLDRTHGGQRGAPKFPMPVGQRWFLSHSYRTGDMNKAKVIFRGADRMVESGIFDHIGGGFARYATDEAWKIPHFEKMLYDNGQLLDLYADVHRLQPSRRTETAIRKTMDWIRHDMTTAEGGIMSAIDADSEGVEGKYYIWTQAELERHLPDVEQQNLFFERYDIRPEGNWEHGQNILHAVLTIEELAHSHQLSEREVEFVINSSLKKLGEVRQDRVPPITDYKILASWNALCAHGMLSAYWATQDKTYLTMAKRVVHFIRDEMMADGQLFRTKTKGVLRIPGFLEDYATVIRVFISMYEAELDEALLTKAKELTDQAMTLFYDMESKMFFMNALEDGHVMRQMNLMDNVIPSGNSMMAHNLLLLGHYFEDERYIDITKTMAAQILPTLSSASYPGYYSLWLEWISYLDTGLYEIAITGPEAHDWIKALRRHYLPGTLIVGTTKESALPLLVDKGSSDQTLAYICHLRVCQAPMDNIDEVIDYLKEAIVIPAED